MALIGLFALAGDAVHAYRGTTVTALSSMDDGYTYQVVAHGEGAGFEAVGFGDSA